MKRFLMPAVAVALLSLAATPAFAERAVSGDFSGKLKCESGTKKAGFKDSLTGNTVWYSLNEVSNTARSLSWEDSSNPMSFDTREKTKVNLERVAKKLRDLNCDTADNPAQSGNGLGAGVQNGTTDAQGSSAPINGTTMNGYQERKQAE